MREILEQIGIDSTFILAGLVGSIAGSKNSKKTWIAKLGSILLGTGSSIFCTPLVCDLISITNERSKFGVAVFIGYLGIQGVQQLLTSKINA